MVSLGQRELEEETEERRGRTDPVPRRAEETFLRAVGEVNKDTSVPEMKMWGQDVMRQGGTAGRGTQQDCVIMYVLGLCSHGLVK